MKPREMKPSDALISAKEHLSIPSFWTKSAMARDRYGVVCRAGMDIATCWCAAGAVIKVSPRTYYSDLVYYRSFKYLSDAQDLCNGHDSISNVENYNDHPLRTHEEILKWFDRAISDALECGD